MLDENIKEGWMKAYEDIGMSEVAVLRLHQLDQLHLDLAHLLLPDLVVAVRDQILSHLGNNEGGSEIPIWKTNLCQGECQPGMSFGRRGKGSDFNMELLPEVAGFVCCVFLCWLDFSVYAV